MRKSIVIIVLLLLVLSLGMTTTAFAEPVAETNKLFDFEDLTVSSDWDAAEKFTIDSADGNYGQDRAGTWTSIVEVEGSKMLKFEAKTVNARKLLRMGYTSLDKFTFSFDFKVDFATITTGQFVVVPVVRLKAGTNWETHCWEPSFSSSIYDSQHLLQSRLNFRPYAEVGQSKNITPNEFHKITVTGDGAAIYVYSDGILLQSYVAGDKNYTTGDVGILIYGGGNVGGEAVYLDNVSVKAVVEVPTPPIEAEKALSIDFSDAAHVNLFAPAAGYAVEGITKEIENGKLKFSITGAAADSFMPLKLDYHTLSEFAYSMDFEFSAATKDFEFSALSRMGTEWSNKSIEANLKVADNGQFNLAKMLKRPYAIVNQGETFTSGSHKLTVSGVDGTIRMYIDEKMIYSCDAGSDYAVGNLGLVVSGKEGTLFIDNVEVKLSADGYNGDVGKNDYTLEDTLDVSYATETSTDIFKKNTKDADNGGTLEIVGGELQVKLEPTGDWQGSAWRLGNAGENFTLTLDFALSSGMFGVCVRVPHEDSWMTTSIMMQANGGKILLFSYKEGEVVQYGDADYGFMIYYDRYMQLKIVGEGKKITLMLGDVSYTTIDISNIVSGSTDESTQPTGEIAFVSYASKSTEIAETFVKKIKLTQTADYTRPIIWGEEESNPDEEAAQIVTQGINNLPAIKFLKLADTAAVVAARTAYNSLTATQKELVSADILAILVAAEVKIAELEAEKGGFETGGGGCSSDVFPLGSTIIFGSIMISLMLMIIRKKQNLE